MKCPFQNSSIILFSVFFITAFFAFALPAQATHQCEYDSIKFFSGQGCSGVLMWTDTGVCGQMPCGASCVNENYEGSQSHSLSASFVASPTCGHGPNANAGPDQVLEDLDANGVEKVTLTALGSTDFDGFADIVSFEWKEGASVLASGTNPNPTITLAVGEHTIVLTVTDKTGLSDTDTVVVTIVAICPLEDGGGGLVPCGRICDDPSTPEINEATSCTFCHFFYLINRIVTFLFTQFLPVLALLFITLSGIVILTARGNAHQLSTGKQMLLWSLIGIVALAVCWVLFNSFFTYVGAKKWTGLTGEEGTITAVSGSTFTVTVDDPWDANEWVGLGFTITTSSNEDIIGMSRTVTSNSPTMATTESWGFDTPLVGDTFRIGGWWQFACGEAPLLELNFVVLTASTSSVPEGGPVELRWSVSGEVVSCTASESPIETSWEGSKETDCSPTCSQGLVPSAIGTHVYTLTCMFSDGETLSATAEVLVAPMPVISLSASPVPVTEGSSFFLSWTVSNALSCTAFADPTDEEWSGSKPFIGGTTITPLALPGDYPYTLRCTGTGGTKQETVLISVVPDDPPRKTVFVTSDAYSSNLGGLDGADQKCQMLAKEAGISGAYRAWLSAWYADDTIEGPPDRLKPDVGDDGKYRLTNGTVVAENWADLTDGELLVPIQRDESGNLVELYQEAPMKFSSLVWTATEPDGSLTIPQIIDADCSDWTSIASPELKGPGLGDFFRKDTLWTKAAFNTHCNSERPLYCFEIGAPSPKTCDPIAGFSAIKSALDSACGVYCGPFVPSVTCADEGLASGFVVDAYDYSTCSASSSASYTDVLMCNVSLGVPTTCTCL